MFMGHLIVMHTFLSFFVSTASSLRERERGISEPREHTLSRFEPGSCKALTDQPIFKISFGKVGRPPPPKEPQSFRAEKCKSRRGRGRGGDPNPMDWGGGEGGRKRRSIRGVVKE